MAEARQYAEWSRACEVLATLHNINRGPNDDAISGEQLNPFQHIKPETPQQKRKKRELEEKHRQALKEQYMRAWGKK